MSDILDQARDRAGKMPSGTRQAVLIETRGMKIGAQELDELRQNIATRSNGLIALENIDFIGGDYVR